MKLFEFELKSLDLIEPFGTKEDYHLHWFGLSDGQFYINCKGQKVFKSTEKYIQEIGSNCIYVDYFVSRFHQDLLDHMIEVLIPVSRARHHILKDQESLHKLTEDIYEKIDSTNDDIVINKYCAELENLHRGVLDCGYLQYAPQIRMWLYEKTVYISCVADQISKNGNRVWEESHIHYEISIDQYKEEIRDFHDRFIKAMSHRIDQISQTTFSPNIKLDLVGLKENHLENSLLLEDRLNLVVS